ncbi:hypothetical protein B0A50_05521 [Salinomyces thailandicus]|uniref:Uncharacterized protein n=1 Tax=Salinomyces thailandicus TaxID=706561 RepID=A0A4V5N5N1_9PEZI|nr:hypothetical protein B0A50_05521 [Salinomyces thailandica]
MAPQWYGQPASYDNVSIVEPNPRHGHWINTWTAMPQLTEFNNLPPAEFNETDQVYYNSTIRQTLKVTIGAERTRLRISNAFCLNELPSLKVTMALPVAEAGKNLIGSSGIDTSTRQTLTISGNASITIPNGALAV